MLPFPIQESKFDPIEKMAETLFNLLVINRVAKEQPENNNLLEQAFDKFQAVETQISSMIDDRTIDAFLKPEFFAYLGYFGCESILKKLHENNKLAPNALSNALAHAVISHRRFESLFQQQSENPDNPKYKPVPLDWLYSDLDQTYCGAFNKHKHSLFDTLLLTRRQSTSEFLQSLFLTILNSREMTLDQYKEALNQITKNYNLEAMTFILKQTENSTHYQDALLNTLVAALNAGIKYELRMFIVLYVEAGGNLDLQFACPAILAEDKSDTPQPIKVECHLLHLALARADGKLFTLLAGRFKDIKNIPPIDKVSDEELPVLDQIILLNDLKLNLLHMSIISGLKTVSADLIERKIVDLNERSAKGTTALMMAAAEKQTDTVQLLIKHNADPLLQCNKGKTAITFTDDPETLIALSMGAAAWMRKIQRRNEIIANLNKAKEAKAIEATPVRVAVAVAVPEFVKAADNLLNSAKSCYLNMIKKLNIDSLYDYENRFMPESITYLEGEKAHLQWKSFFNQIYKSMYALAPYLGFFGAHVDPVEDFLKLLNYDRIPLILMAAYSAPNRTQIAKTGALDSFIYANPELKAQYASHINNHTRMNKELLSYRKDLRDYLFPLIANLIKSNMDEYLFGFAVTSCAQNNDTELLRFIVDTMMACKKPELQERYKTFLLKGPNFIYKNPEDSTQATFSPAPEHVRQFYFDNIGDPFAKKEAMLAEMKAEKAKPAVSAKSKNKKKKKKKKQKNKSSKIVSGTSYDSESDSDSEASDKDIAENISSSTVAPQNPAPIAEPLPVPVVQKKAAPLAPQPVKKTPPVSVYSAIAEHTSTPVSAAENKKSIPDSPVLANKPIHQSPLLAPAKAENTEIKVSGTTESIFTALAEQPEVKIQETEMSLADEYSLERSALTVLEQDTFDRIYAQKNAAAFRLFDLDKSLNEQHARVHTLETRLAKELEAQRKAQIEAELTKQPIPTKGINYSSLIRLSNMKNYLVSINRQYTSQLTLFPKAERYEEVVANDNNHPPKRDPNIL